LIASHVIEHTTDLIGFLDTAATLLTPDGLVILAVPDKRYCFDYFQPLTTTGDVLDAHAERRSRHTRRVVFNQKACAVSNGGAIAWGQRATREIAFVCSIEQAAGAFSTASEHPTAHVDMHAWQFSPGELRTHTARARAPRGSGLARGASITSDWL
jgi:hypothetical protein